MRKTKDNPQILADFIRSARENRGYSQEDLAEAAQISLRSVNNIENCRGDCRYSTVIRILSVLKTDMNALIVDQSDIDPVAENKLLLFFRLCAEYDRNILIQFAEFLSQK